MTDTKAFLLDYLTSPIRGLEGIVKMPMCSRFFEPNPEFIEWCKATYPNAHWIDCGAGQGHITKLLRDSGLEAAGLDLYPCESDIVIDDMIPMDSAMYPFAKDNVALICRPCRGDWIRATIIKAVENNVPVVYVGRDKNVASDLFQLPYKVEQVLTNIGKEGENLWLVTKHV